MKVSIIIDNYNYGRFLAEAIDSALDQTWSEVEVVVVDDGSTDDSREIIAGYGNRLLSVLKENGGQASALNAGFQASSGEIVFFLDSDDTLDTDAVEKVIPHFSDEEVVKVHWTLREVNEFGESTGRTFPRSPLPMGDLSRTLLESGPTSSISSPTSGNAWRRTYLLKVMPIPEQIDYYKTCADEYLFTLAPAFGKISALTIPKGIYRIHGSNIFAAKSELDKLEFEIAGFEQCCSSLAEILQKNGFEIDLESWRKNSWFHRLKASVDELTHIIPTGQSFILVDDDTWGAADLFPEHTVRPFLERDGVSWGPPSDSAAAIRELNRARQNDVPFLVLAWPAFWWFDTYSDFLQYTDEHFPTLIRNERLIIFDLRTHVPSIVTSVTTDEAPCVSIVINNYNYAQFLEEAIESALNQSYPNKEIIVVDDGSTDNSREIITHYSNRILPIFQANGGQGAAYNAGFAASQGDWICFLDADDRLIPNALEELIPLTRKEDVIKLQWHLRIIDENGRPDGIVIPKDDPPQGDLRERVLKDGPLYDWNFTPPGSGNLWSKRFLKQVFPMPESPYRNGADVYLVTLAPIFGLVLTAPSPLGDYRMHGSNNYSGRELDDERVLNYIQRFDSNCSSLSHFLELQGVDSDPNSWRERNFNYIWPTRLLEAKDHIRRLIPAGCHYILVNDNEWGEGEPVEDRKSIPFLERNGEYWGQPSNDAEALGEFRRLQQAGADYIVFWWTAFWWLDHYPEFYYHLRAHFPCLLKDESVIIFQLNILTNMESDTANQK